MAEVAMPNYALVAAVLLCVGLGGPSQEKKETEKQTAESKIPPEEAKRENPVKPMAASIAQGKKQYAFDCAMCHGKDGDGKGDLAEELKLKLRDWRDPAALKDLTDGELFYILTKGKGQMTGDEDRTKPEMKWNMINYVRSLAKKEPAPPPKP